MSTSYTIALFPCGCVVERTMHIHQQRGYVECPWCDATFKTIEYARWSRSVHEVFAVLPASVLVRVKERLFEVTGICGDCETLLVRDGVGAYSFHLRAAASDVKFLTN